MRRLPRPPPRARRGYGAPRCARNKRGARGEPQETGVDRAASMTEVTYVTEVEPLAGHSIRTTFSDGAVKEIDLGELLASRGVFSRSTSSRRCSKGSASIQKAGPSNGPARPASTQRSRMGATSPRQAIASCAAHFAGHPRRCRRRAAGFGTAFQPQHVGSVRGSQIRASPPASEIARKSTWPAQDPEPWMSPTAFREEPRWKPWMPRLGRVGGRPGRSI